MASRSRAMLAPWSEQPLPTKGEPISPHMRGAMAYAERYGTYRDQMRMLWRMLFALVGVVAVCIAVMAHLYTDTRVELYALDPTAAHLESLRLSKVTEVEDLMERDAVQRFFRSLRSASHHPRHQQMLSDTVLALTAAGSPAHRAVESFAAATLPERRNAEIDAQVQAHPIGEHKWRVDIVETDRHRRRQVLRAYATVEVALHAKRNVDLNPWGVFVRKFSVDLVSGGTP